MRLWRIDFQLKTGHELNIDEVRDLRYTWEIYLMAHDEQHAEAAAKLILAPDRFTIARVSAAVMPWER